MSNGGSYDSKPTPELRMGDILCGLPALEHVTDTLKPDEEGAAFSISLRNAKYSVVMSPCCSIGHGVVCLAPLQQVIPQLYNNPYLEEDLTRVNRRMTAKDAMPPVGWEKLPSDVQTARLAEGDTYTLLEFFIYDEAPQLAAYTLRVGRDKAEQAVGHYMIDFSTVYRVRCKEVQQDGELRSAPKILELSVHARKELRDKLSFYYGRATDEDRAQLEY